MPIRHAREADAEAIVGLAAVEHSLSPWRDQPFDAEAATQTARQFISGGGRTALFSPTGGYLLGLVQPTGFSRRLMAVEFAWFAQDGSGMDLLSRFEGWARNMGAIGVSIHTLGADRRLEQVLTLRRHYTMTGASMFKKLEA